MAQLTIEQLQQDLQEIKQTTRSAMLGTKNILRMEDVCELTGYQKSHIYTLTRNREIPHYKRGNTLFFKREEIEAWLTEFKVETQSLIDSKIAQYLHNDLV